jgi:hypothetical protein
MSECALVLHKAEAFQVPAIVADVCLEATKRFCEFFTVPIRNKSTRMAYYQAIGQFLDWCQRAGFSNLEGPEVCCPPRAEPVATGSRVFHDR